MAKTIQEINEKIKRGKAVVVTAEEMIDIVRKKGEEKAAREVDVVTTGTFGPMCSSGAYINIGSTSPRIKLGGGKCYLNGVPAYCGFAAADIMIGASALPDDDPRNKYYPGRFRYGGGHVIEALVKGEDVLLVGSAYGTDCYPSTRIEKKVNINNLRNAVLFNPRNSYQNYNVAVNLSDKVIYTYMGILKPRMGNANYCSAGQLSPLLNDPFYRVTGIGTRIFLGGGVGYIAWHGTQHNPDVPRGANGVPKVPAGTIAVIGDLKGMNSRWLRGASIAGYGVSLFVGIGIPIPVIDEEIAFFTSVRDEDIIAPVVDYGGDYPEGRGEIIDEVDYAQLRLGEVKIRGKKVPAASLSSYYKAREIAGILKEWILEGKFYLSYPVEKLPGSEKGIKFEKQP